MKHKGFISGLGWPCSSNDQATNVSCLDKTSTTNSIFFILGLGNLGFVKFLS